MELHDRAIQEFGSPAGLRSRELLESAVIVWTALVMPALFVGARPDVARRRAGSRSRAPAGPLAPR